MLLAKPTTDLPTLRLSPFGFDAGGEIPHFDHGLDNQKHQCLALDRAWAPALGLFEAAQLFAIS